MIRTGKNELAVKGMTLTVKVPRSKNLSKKARSRRKAFGSVRFCFCGSFVSIQNPMWEPAKAVAGDEGVGVLDGGEIAFDAGANQ